MVRETNSGAYYYNSTSGSVFYLYHDAEYEWWRYDRNINDWEFDQADSSLSYPTDIRGSRDEISYRKLEEAIGKGLTECTGSRAFIDRHHPAVRQGYYIGNDSLYYYLNNQYGTNSGWYEFDQGEWEYLGKTDVKEELGEDIWYDTDDYYASSSYSSLDSDAIYAFTGQDTWNPDFSDTGYYRTYEKNLEDYEDSHKDSDNKSWFSWDDDDDDSGWDWDSGDSWDSGWSDWDSDW